ATPSSACSSRKIRRRITSGSGPKSFRTIDHPATAPAEVRTNRQPPCAETARRGLRGRGSFRLKERRSKPFRRTTEDDETPVDNNDWALRSPDVRCLAYGKTEPDARPPLESLAAFASTRLTPRLRNPRPF